jgi:hypothetical protein
MHDEEHMVTASSPIPKEARDERRTGSAVDGRFIGGGGDGMGVCRR